MLKILHALKCVVFKNLDITKRMEEDKEIIYDWDFQAVELDQGDIITATKINKTRKHYVGTFVLRYYKDVGIFVPHLKTNN